jgi:YVTN family beta-propeller protein
MSTVPSATTAVPSSSAVPAPVPPDVWRETVTAACTAAGEALFRIPAPDSDADVDAYATFVDAVRTTLAEGPRISRIPGIPPELANAVAERESGIDAALTEIAQAAATGDRTAARHGMDTYGFHLAGIAMAVVEARATCGPVDPAHVRAASVNGWLDAPPITVSAGFGSIWIAENHGHRVARIDASTGQPIATIEVGYGAAIGQPADGRMWMRTEAEIVAIDPQTNTIAARLPKIDVGPTASRFHATDGALWICDGPRLHRFDPTTLRRLATIELGIQCGNVTAAPGLVVIFPFRDATPPQAAFIDAATNQVVGRVHLPAPVFFATIQTDTVFFAGFDTSLAAVVDRATWTVTSTPDLGRRTAGGTLATDGTSLYVPAADSGAVLVIDATTLAVTRTLEPVDPWSVTFEDGGLWVVAENGAIAQRFEP